MTNLVSIALGGALGACLRYGLQAGLQAVHPYFPWGTFVANAVGCFLAGYAMRYVPGWSEPGRLFFMTGFLGALTTLSSFSLETVTLLDERRIATAFLYWAMSAGLCVLLCGFGFYLAAVSLGSDSVSPE